MLFSPFCKYNCTVDFTEANNEFPIPTLPIPFYGSGNCKHVAVVTPNSDTYTLADKVFLLKRSSA